MAEPKYDIVEKAEHYNQGGIECIDALRAALGPEGFEAFCRGSVIKYLWRSPHKGKMTEDAKKARYYLRKLIEEQES